MEEYKIHEDFIQISELVDTENAFINRSPPIDSTNRSFSECTDLILEVPDEKNEEVLFYERFFTEYLGSPALLSEKISASLESVLLVYQSLINCEKKGIRIGDFAGELDFWILGASYNDTLRIDANDDMKCGAHSCYEQILKSGKICKPGFYSSLILLKITIRIFNLLFYGCDGKNEQSFIRFENFAKNYIKKYNIYN